MENARYQINMYLNELPILSLYTESIHQLHHAKENIYKNSTYEIYDFEIIDNKTGQITYTHTNSTDMIS